MIVELKNVAIREIRPELVSFKHLSDCISHKLKVEVNEICLNLCQSLINHDSSNRHTNRYETMHHHR